MNWTKPLLLCCLSASLFFLLNFKHGDIPPLGKFLNPFAGFWQNSTSGDEIPATLYFKGLQDTVRILWDDRRVPHLFAKNMHDLFFAQGYCVARDRLWQMDFQARAAAGRLSEVLGARTLGMDRFRRRIGLNLAAEQVARNTLADPLMREVAEGYRDGVNAWIAALDERNFPVEFKILDYRPEEWSVLKTALILSNFSLTLSFGNNDSAMTLVRGLLGDSVVSRFYPDILPFADPVVPRGTPWEFKPLPVRNPAIKHSPDSKAQARTSHSGTGPWSNDVEAEETFVKGSNNWAVSGSRTANGHPMLCNDPHLSLTLPSLWYEVQLVAPGINVYGVSSPGTPGVLIGFNEKIAFGETNAGSDVIDWYEIKFKDASNSEYLYGGTWRPTSKRIEVISVRGGPSAVDTIVHTHHGPVVARPGEEPVDPRVPPGCAMRWTALDSSSTFSAFLRINMAGDYQEFVRALSTFDGPAQNFAYADVEGNIAIWHNGKLPLRWKDQGKFLCDGTDPLDEWQGWIPRDQLPHALNPYQGFVSSANQPPGDSTYPYYIGWNYSSFERSERINERLSGMEKATPHDMMGLQQDIVNLRAAKALPVLLRMIDDRSLSAEDERILNELRGWHYDYDANLTSPQVFEYWWRELQAAIWLDDMRHGTRTALMPRADVTLQLILSNPESPSIDNRDTPERETLADIARRSFAKAVRQLKEEFGPFGHSWAWGTIRGTTIRHLAQIPGLGRPKLMTGGNYNTVNAVQGSFGPSWRMVVDLGSPPSAWGVYPGGQSGNPGSPFYDNFIESWQAGTYYDLVFLQSPDEMNRHLIGTTTMRGDR